jgi:hypothetical protein
MPSAGEACSAWQLQTVLLRSDVGFNRPAAGWRSMVMTTPPQVVQGAERLVIVCGMSDIVPRKGDLRHTNGRM